MVLVTLATLALLLATLALLLATLALLLATLALILATLALLLALILYVCMYASHATYHATCHAFVERLTRGERDDRVEVWHKHMRAHACRGPSGVSCIRPLYMTSLYDICYIHIYGTHLLLLLYIHIHTYIYMALHTTSAYDL